MDEGKEDRMHGSIFVLLKRFIEREHDYSMWVKLKEQAGVESSPYEMSETYPTRELFAIVNTASRATGIPANTLLERFGEFLVPDLLLIYKKYVRPEWGTYEMLLNTEAAMHGAVRKTDGRAEPPVLQVTGKGPGQLVVDYHSRRRMAGVAVGIIRGIAAHYQESDRVQVTRLSEIEDERVQIRVDFLT